ncbi:zinc ribbon domain-containing protein [Butyrivibrio sp. XPD2002]|uniref:zinc ribbon domain-containing protein n=1 Tax=Butyrivibrio sp. XPD2002 TaxID=1280665 RepID=UPI000412E274|nr:zinc ribbon domain-containing protein [Butyrivibrio sp. XPD2002]
MKCPKCGAETTEKFCPYCGSDLQQPQPTVQQPTSPQQNSIPKTGYSYASGANNAAPTYHSNSNSVSAKKKHSIIGIAAFILSFLGPLALIGVILAIIDLIKDKSKSHKHGLTIAALVIGGWMLISITTTKMLMKNYDALNTASNIAESNEATDSSKAVEEEPETTDITSESTEKEEQVTEPAENIESTANEEQVAESEENTESVENESISEEPTMTKDEFIASCAELNYKDIAREPEKYVGQNFYFTCYVNDVREGGLLSGYQKYFVTYAFDMDKAQKAVNDGWADDIQEAKYYGWDADICVWIMDNRDESDPDYIKVLNNDIITVYGTFTGMTETKNSLTNEKGEQVSLDVKYVDLLAQ